jgi:hypothetical protein
MTIRREECMPLILEHVPDFSDRWQAHLDHWDGEDAGPCNDMATFAGYVVEVLQNKRQENLEAVFGLIEKLMVEGDDTVRDVTATCFIETLQNYASGSKIDSRDFVPYLGSESRAYAKAWDEFTGVKTEGL